MSPSAYTPTLSSTLPIHGIVARVMGIRIPEDLREVLQYEADLAGVSLSQYLREAGLMRAYYARGERGEDRDALAAIERLMKGD
jgi:transcriptional regulator with XRE-family HTH domain